MSKYKSWKKEDFEKLDIALSLKFTQKACAAYLQCNVKTIANQIKKQYGMDFDEYAEMQVSPTKIKLVQKAIAMALDGNVTMLIFSLKNIVGWTDQPTEIEKMKETVNQLVIQYNETSGKPKAE